MPGTGRRCTPAPCLLVKFACWAALCLHFLQRAILPCLFQGIALESTAVPVPLPERQWHADTGIETFHFSLNSRHPSCASCGSHDLWVSRPFLLVKPKLRHEFIKDARHKAVGFLISLSYPRSPLLFGSHLANSKIILENDSSEMTMHINYTASY